MRLTTAPHANDEARSVHVLLVEDEPDLRTALRYNLKRAGFHVTDAGNGREAVVVLTASTSPGGRPVDVIVSDIMMPEMDGIALAKHVRAQEATRETPFLFLTAKGDPTDKVEGFRAGADDYLTKPFDLEELLARVHVQARRALAAKKMRALLLGSETPSGDSDTQRSASTTTAKNAGDLFAKVAMWEARFPALAAIRARSIVGQSTKMLTLLREILIRAPGKDPVLIVGETGSGKTGVAEALYRLGPRASGPFRVVNCAELSASDSAITLGKLFGYGKGSGLTNVPKDGQPGLLEDVDGGTLFLDEIHRLPLEAQAMLLLPIEGRSFHPAVGKGDPKTVDVKFLFATNVDLQAECDAGRFPFDLYQRLSASKIAVPALAERREDIASLAQHFLDECKDELGLPDAVFAPSLLRAFTERAWPGNVRELRALVREATRRAAFDQDSVVSLTHLPEAEGKSEPPSPVSRGDVGMQVPGQNDDEGGFWNEVEMREIAVLRKHRFKIAPAETELGLSSKSRTLTNHLRGMCFKAIVHATYDLQQAARLLVGRDDEALLDRTLDRMGGYLDMVDHHVGAHTTSTLFNNLPRDYRKFVEDAIDKSRPGASLAPPRQRTHTDDDE
jgi:DNA-binding NtrC family response regulator